MQPCHGPDWLLGNHWLEGFLYLSVSYSQVMPPYGHFVFQMNKIKIGGEVDFLPDFELLDFGKHTATSEECLKRPEFCSEETALLSM